jgi:hypothetical protein
MQVLIQKTWDSAAHASIKADGWTDGWLPILWSGDQSLSSKASEPYLNMIVNYNHLWGSKKKIIDAYRFYLTDMGLFQGIGMIFFKTS